MENDLVSAVCFLSDARDDACNSLYSEAIKLDGPGNAEDNTTADHSRITGQSGTERQSKFAAIW